MKHLEITAPKKLLSISQNSFKPLQTAYKKGLTLFEQFLKDHAIVHQKIQPYTPRHNGKAKRSHRKDNEE
ncbi:hypothetical protein HMPREF0080_00494 [Anaeroglobus geminatus F0357]|uniref:Integrase catalytic domain-containing protein n=1 Tax=Anaeroglobus geminatus F0357 TaxID=861450 RepID=G9YFT2_9FIRM|nr:hypothetical protein HMPREF0080_00494 [Anaeroglobus geminatus F0357]